MPPKKITVKVSESCWYMLVNYSKQTNFAIPAIVELALEDYFSGKEFRVEAGVLKVLDVDMEPRPKPYSPVPATSRACSNYNHNDCDGFNFAGALCMCGCHPRLIETSV